MMTIHRHRQLAQPCHHHIRRCWEQQPDLAQARSPAWAPCRDGRNSLCFIALFYARLHAEVAIPTTAENATDCGLGPVVNVESLSRWLKSSVQTPVVRKRFFSMPKEPKTKGELEELMVERVKGIPISHLEVSRDPIYGWTVLVVADPRDVVDCQARTDAIAGELHALYDLKE
jgi:hypothetical protein